MAGKATEKHSMASQKIMDKLSTVMNGAPTRNTAYAIALPNFW